MSFSSAHFVISEGICESLHGHNYSVELRLQGAIDELEMVLDFRKVKEEVSQICKSLDHKMLLPRNSSTISVFEEDQKVTVNVDKKKYVFPAEDCIILPIKSTTAELLAKYIHDQLEFKSRFRATVCVGESSGSVACYSDK